MLLHTLKGQVCEVASCLHAVVTTDQAPGQCMDLHCAQGGYRITWNFQLRQVPWGLRNMKTFRKMILRLGARPPMTPVRDPGLSTSIFVAAYTT